MKKNNHIVIVGAGIVGLTSAALLAQSSFNKKYHIHVIDAGEPTEYKDDEDIDLRVSALSIGSIKIFQCLGIWQKVIKKHAYPYANMRVWDASDVADGMSAISFEAMALGLSELGFIVENNLLKAELQALISSLDISMHYGIEIISIKESKDKSGVDVHLLDNEPMYADLLIGADGSNSLTRKLFNIHLKKHSYSQSAFVVHVETEKDHLDTAWQRFLPEGPIALLPLGKNRVSVVWSTTSEKIALNTTLNDEELGKLLTKSTDYALGNLKVISKRANFDLKYQHAVNYIDKNFALVGDAAHNIHPLAGQGVNLGIADADCLITTINKTLNRNEYIGDKLSLRPYERKRKGVNWMMLSFVDSLNKLFLIRSDLVGNLRNIGMRLFNKSRYLKSYAIKIALGIHS